WSKDEIITTAFKQHDWGVWAVAFVTAIITAFYMTRAVLLTFFGDYRGTARPHHPPRVMLAPMVVLAALSVVAGFLGPTHLFADWVHFGPVVREPFDYGFAAISFLGVAAGLAMGYRLYSRWQEREPLMRLGRAYTFVERKYLLDELYLHGVVRPIQYPLASDVNRFDRGVIDGAVNGAGVLARGLGSVLRC